MKPVTVALAPNKEEPDVVDLVPWEDRYLPREIVGYPAGRIHRDGLEAFGLKEAFDRAQDEGEFVKARFNLELLTENNGA